MSCRDAGSTEHGSPVVLELNEEGHQLLTRRHERNERAMRMWFGNRAECLHRRGLILIVTLRAFLAYTLYMHFGK
jgi:hypothetical protein